MRLLETRALCSVRRCDSEACVCRLPLRDARHHLRRPDGRGKREGPHAGRGATRAGRIAALLFRSITQGEGVARDTAVTLLAVTLLAVTLLAGRRP